MNELIKTNLIKLDEINWDYLFACTLRGTYESYSAELASRWTEVSSEELIETCKIGHNLPGIFRNILKDHFKNKEK